MPVLDHKEASDVPLVACGLDLAVDRSHQKLAKSFLAVGLRCDWMNSKSNTQMQSKWSMFSTHTGSNGSGGDRTDTLSMRDFVFLSWLS